MRSLLLFITLLPLSAVAAETPWPEKIPADRYDTMRGQSPFALATVVEAPKPATESFAANWELTGAGTLPDGRDYVSVRSRDRRVAFSLAGSEVSTDPDSQGVSLSSVNWSTGWRKTSATLKKGTEFAKVEYSPEAPTAPAQPNPGNLNGAIRTMNNVPGMQGVQTMPGVLPGAYPGNAQNANQIGANRVPGGIRNNVAPNGLVIPGNQPNLPSANIIQAQPPAGAPPTRKLRVINTR